RVGSQPCRHAERDNAVDPARALPLIPDAIAGGVLRLLCARRIPAQHRAEADSERALQHCGFERRNTPLHPERRFAAATNEALAVAHETQADFALVTAVEV